ncbi:MAG: signal peptidase II [bacterium]
MQFYPRRAYLGVLVAVTVLVLDQLTKAAVAEHMRLHESLTVIPGFLNLTYVRNTGAAFGLLATQSPGIRSLVLIASSLIAMGFIVWIWWRERVSSWCRVISLGLILGGALGNLVDRIRLGEVVDFLDIYWGKYHWPAFNVADSAVTVGILVLLPSLILSPKAR